VLHNGFTTKKLSVKTRPIVGGKKMQEILGKFIPLQFDEIFSANAWFMHQAII
jgi:hypothetical protein